MIFDAMRHILRYTIIYWFFEREIEIILVKVLFISSIIIRDNGGVEGNDGVGISSNVSDMFDACRDI
jgi:hypothetical protein